MGGRPQGGCIASRINIVIDRVEDRIALPRADSGLIAAVAPRAYLTLLGEVPSCILRSSVARLRAVRPRTVPIRRMRSGVSVCIGITLHHVPLASAVARSLATSSITGAPGGLMV